MSELAQSLGLALPAFIDEASPDWLSALRARGSEQFWRLGLPSTRVEEWKYTSLRALERARPAVGRLEVEADGVVVQGDDIPGIGHHAREGRSNFEEPVEGKDHVLRLELLAMVELHAPAKVEGPLGGVRV